MSAVKKDLLAELLNGSLLDSVLRTDAAGLPERIVRELKIEQLTSCFEDTPGLHSTKELIQWLDDARADNHIFAKREGLNTLEEWRRDESGFFSHRQRKFFRVIGVKTMSPSREVSAWSQPILDNEGTGIIGLLMKRIKGRSYFLMQAKVDAGNRNTVQIGPTVQFNPGNYIDNEKLRKPFLFDRFLNSEGLMTIKESMQAEEGGRFFKEEHLHKILLLPDELQLGIPPQYRWFSLNQIRFFLHLGDSVNSSARSILACLV
ncbi:MAG: hypothetical protein EPN25_13215 [Nitrospirae bacterium]|nr:MAG: hypothetical protein EPN25_13215 [Nitrospirota bacterium]